MMYDMDDPDQYIKRLGSCLNCRRPIYGWSYNGKQYPIPCECWENEPEPKGEHE